MTSQALNHAATLALGIALGALGGSVLTAALLTPIPSPTPPPASARQEAPPPARLGWSPAGDPGGVR